MAHERKATKRGPVTKRKKADDGLPPSFEPLLKENEEVLRRLAKL